MSTKVSIVIPAYNEQAFIGNLIERINKVDTRSIGYEKEIIVVDDGSTDGTAEVVEPYVGEGLVLLRQSNTGKGRAVQAGVEKATGEYILVQDADLEYDPDDYLPMLEALSKGAGSVYGSRILGQIRDQGWRLPCPGRHPSQGFGSWSASVILTLWAWLLYGTWISDTLTGYKIYPTDLLRSFDIVTHGFETDHEITAKLIKAGVEIVEVPISYQPRSLEEGKKIGFRDGLVAVWTLWRFRWSR